MNPKTLIRRILLIMENGSPLLLYLLKRDADWFFSPIYLVLCVESRDGGSRNKPWPCFQSFHPWLHQHSATMLGHLAQFTYLTRDPVYQEQAPTLVRVFFPKRVLRGPFSICCGSHTFSNNPLTESQIQDFSMWFSGHQPETLYPSLPQARENNNKPRTMTH